MILKVLVNNNELVVVGPWEQLARFRVRNDHAGVTSRDNCSAILSTAQQIIAAPALSSVVGLVNQFQLADAVRKLVEEDSFAGHRPDHNAALPLRLLRFALLLPAL